MAPAGTKRWTERWRGKITWLVSLAALAFAAYTLVYGFNRFPFDEGTIPKCQLRHFAGLAVIWIVGPPIWFWFEYLVLYDIKDKDKNERENVKAQQELSSKVWIAISSAMLGLLFSHWK